MMSLYPQLPSIGTQFILFPMARRVGTAIGPLVIIALHRDPVPLSDIRNSPTLQCQTPKHPRKAEKRECDDDVGEHHHVISSGSHRPEPNLLRTANKRKSSSGEQEARQAFSRRTRRARRSWRVNPEEEIRQAPSDSVRC